MAFTRLTRDVPQGLKPLLLFVRTGTTKVVPSPVFQFRPAGANQGLETAAEAGFVYHCYGAPQGAP